MENTQMKESELVNFPVNMQLPQEHLDILIDVATENNISAEQFAKQIVMNFIAKNYPKGLTNRSTTV